MARARLEVVDVVHGAQVHRVHGEAVEGVGGQRDHLAALQAFNDERDQVRLRLVRMDTKNFSVQAVTPQQ